VRLNSRVLRFGLVGLLNTAIDLSIYLGLRSAGMDLFPANLVSTSAGLSVSFLVNQSFTFKDRAGAGRMRTAGLFLLATGLGLWVLQPLVIAGVEHLLGTWSSADRLLAPPVQTLVPKLAGIAVNIVWNYLAYDRVVFAGRPPEPPAPTAADVVAVPALSRDAEPAEVEDRP
jgi:putative flippase GtrA